MLMERLAGGAIADADIAAIAASGRRWGTATGIGRADVMAAWLAADAPAQAVMLGAVLGAIVKKDGELTANYLTPDKQMGDCRDAAECVAVAISNLMAHDCARSGRRRAGGGVGPGSRFAEAYARRSGGRAGAISTT